jgi:hypothetical protein
VVVQEVELEAHQEVEVVHQDEEGVHQEDEEALEIEVVVGVGREDSVQLEEGVHRGVEEDSHQEEEAVTNLISRFDCMYYFAKSRSVSSQTTRSFDILQVQHIPVFPDPSNG